MLSFHNDPAIKQKYLDRVISHRIADNIIQGTGWYDGKGCAVGCTLESYDHSRYPIELGLPEWLARLEDIIFEHLPVEEAKLWPEKFLSAIPVGVCVEKVKHQLSILRMDRLISIQKKLLENNLFLEEIINEVIAALEVTKKYHESKLQGLPCDLEEESAADVAASSAKLASAAESAASSAADSAAEAARSAVWSAADSAAWEARSAARSAAWSATSATSAADSAADSAEWSAATSAAEAAAWSAADSAAEAARSAAWSAGWEAWEARSTAEAAWSAAWSATSAAESAASSAAWSAAESAAESATSVARSAAWEAWCKQEADYLLQALSELK